MYHYSRNWPVGWKIYLDKVNQELPFRKLCLRGVVGVFRSCDWGGRELVLLKVCAGEGGALAFCSYNRGRVGTFCLFVRCIFFSTSPLRNKSCQVKLKNEFYQCCNSQMYPRYHAGFFFVHSNHQPWVPFSQISFFAISALLPPPRTRFIHG